MERLFWILIFANCFSGITFTSEQPQQILKKIKQTDPIRQFRIEFAAQQRKREKENNLRIKNQRAERLIAYKLAKEGYLQSQLEPADNRISSRRNPTDKQLNKKDSIDHDKK